MGSRSGLYNHYSRLYEGAAATTGYPYLEAEVRYAVMHEYACKPADILCRRTRLAFLNSTAARLALPKVLKVMGECLGWDEVRQRKEILEAEQMLARDFGGPVPNKEDAKLRTACSADVKDIFDRIDVHKKGALTKQGIADASRDLGFPLGEKEVAKAMREMGAGQDGEVRFPEFLMWWNSCSESSALHSKILKSFNEG